MFLPRLAAFLEARKPVQIEEAGANHAAVAVIVTGEPEAALLFVKRKERQGDPWSGHAAFPGGYREAREAAAETAARETLEETGLDLGRVGRRLGQLDDVYPRSVYLPRTIVTPVVFTVQGRTEVRPVDEIERTVWVKARDLLDPALRKPLVLDRPAGRREFEAIHTEGLVIWGLTERIIEQMRQGVA